MIKKLYPYIKLHKKQVIGSLLLGVVVAGIKAWQVALVKPIIDNGLSPDAPFSTAAWPAIVILISATINFPARFFHFYWIRCVVYESTCLIRKRLFNKTQMLPMSFYSQSKQGKLISILSNDTVLFSEGVRSIIDLVREPITAICLLSVAIYQDWQLTIVFFIVAPMFVVIFKKTGTKIRNNQHIVQEEVAAMTHNIAEGISGQKIAKAFNLQEFVLNRFLKSQNRFFNAQVRTTVIEEVAHPLVEWVGALGFAGIIIFAYFRVQSGALSPGGFTSFMAAMALVMDPIRKFSQANVRLNQARAAGDRLFGLLDEDGEKDTGNKNPVNFNESIVVKDLTFSYGEGNVIKKLNLYANKGEKIALVGLSGSGKSTLINLLLGLYPVAPGTLCIDGDDVCDIKLKNLREMFGLVSQDIFLFNDTIKNNLICGGDYTDAQIQKSLDVSYANEFVSKLPLGLETEIGDRGTRLSGGQQQRLTIARAFLRDNDVFLFDEATSALDNESEKVVQKALDELSQNKTVIAVAHRLSTIQEYDRIYVLKEGELIEVGHHEELMEKGGEYSKLYDLSQKK
ncbi:MAG: ABC transporter ATP-binding protein [Bacteriovoracaceae bacterium]|nr:ABC transporter ATP-binding protein [Bacteriovoracaceae bacterium]